jgi:hypothetical protein
MVAGQWPLQGDGCSRGAMVASDRCRVEWKQEHPWSVLTVERCGQSGRSIGKGWVEEVEGKRMGERVGGAECSVKSSPRHFLTINAPLILKMRENVFLGGKLLDRPFRGIF